MKPSLDVTNPELAAQAIGWDPSTVSAGSGRRLPWRCALGHDWIAQVASRVNGRGCPVCSGHRFMSGFNDLRTRYPDVAAEADGWDPSKIHSGSSEVKQWRCIQGHTWSAKVIRRTSSGRGCPVCSGHKVQVGANDLQTTHPSIAAEIRDCDPRTLSAGSKTLALWECGRGHTWRATVSSRTSRASGCPVCANKKVLRGFNDLETSNPELASEAHGWSPKEFTAGSNQRKAWKCAIGHVWTQTISARSAGRGCPVCNNSLVVAGANDLATTHPDLAREAFKWDPSTVTYGSKKRLTWHCVRGHTYVSTPNRRSASQAGCPYCSGLRPIAGVNDLATTHPSLAAQLISPSASEVAAGSHKSGEWECSHGHVWRATIKNRALRGLGCPVCANKKVLAGFNDLATTDPALAGEANGWDPRTLTRSSGRRVGWTCSSGHQWKAAVNNRIRGSGCPSCSTGGFDPNQDGYVYLLDHDSWGLWKVGLTNFPKDRLDAHRRTGWAVVDVRGPMDGHTAQELETHLLRGIRRLGAKFADSMDFEDFDGRSEAWEKGRVDFLRLVDLIRKVDELDRI